MPDVTTATSMNGAPEGPPACPPVTGDPGVDEAVARLTGLAQLAVGDHPVVYEAVHQVLTARLGDLEG